MESFGLEGITRKIRQAGSLAALHRDVPRVRPAFEAVYHIGQTGGPFRQVRCIDLSDVAQADDLGTGTGTRDQRLHLFRR